MSGADKSSWLGANLKRCTVCGNMFEPKHSKQTTCSPECAIKAHKAKVKKDYEQNKDKYREHARARRERIKQAKEATTNRKQSDNMAAITEISKRGVHYGLYVAEMWLEEQKRKREKNND